MTITITATVGGSSSNSYATVTEGDAWHATQLRTDAWDDASTDEKSQALIMATRLLDENIEWYGDPAATTQALQWPRSGLSSAVGGEIDDAEIPQRLKEAEAEFAKYLLISDRLADLTSEGVKRLQVSSIEIEFSESFRLRRKVIPDAVLQMVALWGTLKYGASNQATLVRA